MSTDNVETTNDGPLTLSEAAKAFVATPAPEEVQEDQPDEDEAHEDDHADDDLPDEQDGEDEGNIDDEDQAEPDEGDRTGEEQPEPEQGRFVSDDARVKLADGTFATVAELKAGSLKNADYTQKTQEVATERQAVQSERQTVTQLRQDTEQIRDYTIAVLEQFMPTKPDDALFATDFIRATQMEREFSQRQEQLSYLKAQRQWDQDQTATQRSQEARDRSNSEWGKLVEKLPELKDETRGKALIGELLSYGQQQGYDEQEVRSALAFDHRQAVILKKAMAFDKLQAKKAKTPAKIEGRPPVQRSGKRLNPQGMANRQARVAMDRLTESGSLKDGVQAFLASQKKG